MRKCASWPAKKNLYCDGEVVVRPLANRKTSISTDAKENCVAHRQLECVSVDVTHKKTSMRRAKHLIIGEFLLHSVHRIQLEYLNKYD